MIVSFQTKTLMQDSIILAMIVVHGSKAKASVHEYHHVCCTQLQTKISTQSESQNDIHPAGMQDTRDSADTTRAVY
jgi:hypothetical protein